MSAPESRTPHTPGPKETPGIWVIDAVGIMPESYKITRWWWKMWRGKQHKTTRLETVEATAERITDCLLACEGLANPSAVGELVAALRMNWEHTDDSGRVFYCNCPRFSVLSDDCRRDKDKDHATSCQAGRAALSRVGGGK